MAEPKHCRNSADYQDGFVYGIYRREEPTGDRPASGRPRHPADWIRGFEEACKSRPGQGHEHPVTPGDRLRIVKRKSVRPVNAVERMANGARALDQPSLCFLHRTLTTSEG